MTSAVLFWGVGFLGFLFGRNNSWYVYLTFFYFSSFFPIFREVRRNLPDLASLLSHPKNCNLKNLLTFRDFSAVSTPGGDRVYSRIRGLGWGIWWRICCLGHSSGVSMGGYQFLWSVFHFLKSFPSPKTNFLPSPKNCFLVKNLLTFRILPAGRDLGFFFFWGLGFGLRGGHQLGVLCD